MRRFLPGGVAFLAAMAAAPSALADRMTTSPEQAYDLGDIPNARAVGMGGALNALGVSTTALSLNPANMALARVYHLEALGAYSPEAQRQSFGLAIEDSVINAQHLSGGVVATYNQFDPSGMNRTWTDVRIALAMPIGDYIAIGATTRWLRVNQNVSAGPFGPSYASDGASGSPIFDGLTIDLGATLSVSGFRLGVVGHNLTNPNTPLAPTEAAGGIGYANEWLALEADGLLDFTTWGGTRARAMAGGELFLADRYALRLGWRYDAGTQINAASAGLGYIDPRWSIEVGMRHDLIGAHSETLGVLALRYFYDANGGTNAADEPDPF